MRRPSRARLLSLAAVLLAGCGTAASVRPPAVAPPPPSSPRLVLFVVVDQLRHDTLDRFAPLLDGGLARLRRESVAWSEARHGHAETITAPGHATLATGADPARHGIVGNSW